MATWDKVFKGQILADGEELRSGIVLLNLLMKGSENRYYYFHRGYLNQQPRDGRVNPLRQRIKLPFTAFGENRSVAETTQQIFCIFWMRGLLSLPALTFTTGLGITPQNENQNWIQTNLRGIYE